MSVNKAGSMDKPCTESQAATTRVELRIQLDTLEARFEPIGEGLETVLESGYGCGCDIFEGM